MKQELDSATRAYVASLITSSPITLPYEVFCQEAVARTAAVAPQYAAYPTAGHFPAVHGSVAYTLHSIQVWESSQAGSMGVNVFIVQDKDPEKCLHALGRELAGLKAKLSYDADTAPAPSEPTPTVDDLKDPF